jgi:hypothetical protein
VPRILVANRCDRTCICRSKITKLFKQTRIIISSSCVLRFVLRQCIVVCPSHVHNFESARNTYVFFWRARGIQYDILNVVLAHSVPSVLRTVCACFQCKAVSRRYSSACISRGSRYSTDRHLLAVSQLTKTTLSHSATVKR